MPLVLNLTEEAWQEISRHAMDTFPEECCGLILQNGRLDEVRRCTNVQNKLHALDPDTYPRTAATAYTIDIMELENIMKEAERSGAAIKAFYHSHPQHEAYLSKEDRSFACPFGEPTYPDTAHVVISIYDRAVKEIRAYFWIEEEKDFSQISIKMTPHHEG